jgi:6-phosphofructokinase 1
MMIMQQMKMLEMTPVLERMKRYGLKVGILHAGGPAPGGNRVIAAAAKQFNDRGIGVVGLTNGYEYLQEGKMFPLKEGEHFINITREVASRAIDQKDLIICTSRANPGSKIKCPEDLKDPKKTEKLLNVIDVFEMLRIGALISIGGDDTLKTANFIYQLSKNRSNDPRSIFQGGIVHVPKTIDNDYNGIPWTFGFWSAAGDIGLNILKLHADAKGTSCYHVVECMGRKSGWLTAVASMKGRGSWATLPEEYKDREAVPLEEIAQKLMNIVQEREAAGKRYGVFVIAEGLADKLPAEEKVMEYDRHGNPILGEVKLGEKLATRLKELYKEASPSSSRAFKAHSLGYESRQIDPEAYDTVLTSLLGIGAFRLIADGRFGQMVTARDNFDLDGIPFEELVDPNTLRVVNRGVDLESAFYYTLRATEDSETYSAD